MLVVIVLISLLAALVIPKLYVVRDSAKQKGYEDVLTATVGFARREAEVKKTVAKVKVSGQAIEVVTVDEFKVETLVRSEPMPDGVSIGGLSIRGKESTDSDWSLTVYPDGRTHQAALELSESGRARTLDIAADGRTSWREGKWQDKKIDETWEAGNLEQRTG